ncbi:uncharacterized protein LOC144180269 [Haemaphysalis longicornis]
MLSSCSALTTLASPLNRIAFPSVFVWGRSLLFLAAAVTVAGSFAVTPPTDYERPRVNFTTEVAFLPEGPAGHYLRHLKEKTSTLLGEALQMRHRVSDVGERRWLHAFARRIGLLARDLEQTTLPLRSPSTAPSSVHHISYEHRQQTVPTTGQISPPPWSLPSELVARTTTQETVQEEVRGVGRPEAVTQPNFVHSEADPLNRQLPGFQSGTPSPSAAA